MPEFGATTNPPSKNFARMTDDAGRSQPQADEQLQDRILSTSGTMVGVCATLIGLVKVVEHGRPASHVDEYAGCAAVIFVFSAFFAYLAIRSPRKGRVHGAFGSIADLLFVCGLITLAAISLMFAYDLI